MSWTLVASFDSDFTSLWLTISSLESQLQRTCVVGRAYLRVMVTFLKTSLQLQCLAIRFKMFKWLAFHGEKRAFYVSIYHVGGIANVYCLHLNLFRVE